VTIVRRAIPRALAIAALALAAPASAHGLLVAVQSESNAVTGRVYYSDGAPGAGEFVELRDLSAPASPTLSASTDGEGRFRFAGAPGHRYAVIAHGEEGHTTEMRVTVADGQRGRLTEKPSADGDGMPGLPPAWLVIGITLLVSAGFALWLRMRGGSKSRRPETD